MADVLFISIEVRPLEVEDIGNLVSIALVIVSIELKTIAINECPEVISEHQLIYTRDNPFSIRIANLVLSNFF